VQTIYRYGIVVNAGYIIGFDTERGSIAQGIIDCVEATAVPVNMAGLLFALPTTQLARRLQAEGRLHEGFELQPDGVGDQCTAGLNFHTLRPRADILRDYLQVIEAIYTPASYFGRVLKVGRALDASKHRFRPKPLRQIKELRGFSRVVRKLGLARATARHFWGVLLRLLFQNPRSLRQAVAMMALYLHFGPFSRYVTARLREALLREERRAAEAAALPPAEVA
jgi:hypothetical protein